MSIYAQTVERVEKEESMAAAVAPSKSNPITRATAVTGGGILSGLLIAFLPLLQALPNHIKPGIVETALGAGATVILGSLLHHGWITKAEVQTGETFIEQHLPTIEAAAASLEKTEEGHKLALEAKAAAGRVDARLDGVKDAVERRLAEVETAIGPQATADLKALGDQVYKDVLGRLANLAGSQPANPLAKSEPDQPAPVAEPTATSEAKVTSPGHVEPAAPISGP